MKFGILGTGGHALSVLSIVKLLHPNAKVYSFSDFSPDISKLPPEVIQLGRIGDVPNYLSRDVPILNGVGGTKSAIERNEIYQSFKNLGYKFATLIHPASSVDLNVEIGEGTQIHPGVIIRTGTRIGENVLLNTGSIVDHESIIGDGTVISPGAVICGGVTIDSGCFIGASSTLIQGLAIKQNTFVAAGAVVVRDTKPNSRVLGVPARDVNS